MSVGRNWILPPLPSFPPFLLPFLYLRPLQIPIGPENVFQTKNSGCSDLENQMKATATKTRTVCNIADWALRRTGPHLFHLCISSGQHKPWRGIEARYWREACRLAIPESKGEAAHHRSTDLFNLCETWARPTFSIFPLKNVFWASIAGPVLGTRVIQSII